MKRAAIYARVSTGKQAAGELSLPDQVKQCAAYATANGYEIAGEFVDAGVSARTDKRAEFQRMISLACGPQRPFDAILVHSQSRLFRNTKDLLIYKERLEANGVRFVSITQNLGEGDTADVFHTMLGALDEHNSKETAKHVTRSMKENAEQGFWNGSRAPFGYRTYTAEVRGIRNKKKIEIEEAEAEIVRQIFRLYVHGDGKSGPMGAKRVTTTLNALGARTGTASRSAFSSSTRCCAIRPILASITTIAPMPAERSKGRNRNGWRSPCRASSTTRSFTPPRKSSTASIR